MHASAQAIENDQFTEANLRATVIVDHLNSAVRDVLGQIQPAGDELAFLQAAHRFVCARVKPIYTVNELQPASVTLRKRKGSCSQRFACLEALARARGIATRVRGLWIAGRFWAPRFRMMRPVLPRKVLLAWPQFRVAGAWLSVESLFAPLEMLARTAEARFSNDGESLFDALPHCAIDFQGHTTGCADGRCDLSGLVVADAGLFASRDDLFAAMALFQHTLRGWMFERLFAGRAST